ncbi:MAG TPA: AAA family ATPase, partial [Ardenticatenaceae bacterium]|nr:AAA family ATPase [Ardenticatenaceae bacterium]
QDGGSSGKPRSLLAENLPRTVISASNAAESPTALLARKEMQSWRLLQLEPSALRMPDPFTAPTKLGTDGSHLAASLYHLARLEEGPVGNGNSKGRVRSDAYTQAANRLAELIGDVRAINVDRDERRELLTLRVMSRDGTSHDARALSDGTLRYLALTVLELDPQTHRLLCLEAPENGIHPARIPAMFQLLIDLAVDTDEPVGHDNPLRQVIVNTYSPSMMAQVPADSLIVAELQERVEAGRRFQAASFRWLPDTWREQAQPEVYPLPRGKLLEYLNPVIREEPATEGDGWEHDDGGPKKSERPRRVIDRPDFQPYLAYFMPSSSW